jgi:Flp pilus assembly pilin Flp
MHAARLVQAETDTATVGPFGRARARPSLASDRSAVTAIEYALMGALVALAIVGGVNGYAGNLGTLMNTTFGKIASAI